MVQAKLGSDRRKAGDLDGGMVELEVTDTGSGNSCPGDLICEHIIGRILAVTPIGQYFGWILVLREV
ncbi:MAG: hypothetical protein JRI67_07255 [Deltaproteobacteria bacterium]|nr:hypothetical protein [Deltaproteobacteria bacterium]